ncbi:hypothetical protein Tco_0313685, partial [Tanacetum coccineum]
SKANGLGKDFPNPFMAGSLPKTIKQSNDPPLSRGYTLGSGEDSLELMELMANCTQIVCFVRKKNREICLELILLGTTLSTVSLEFCDKHNMVAYLVKSERSKGFDEIIDFLTSSHIYYALTEKPIIFVSLIEQFWETAILSTTDEGLQAISITIDGHEQLITEAYLRRHLKTFFTPVEIDGLEKDLQQTKKTYSTALTKLVLNVKKLEYKLKSSKANRKSKIVLSDDKEIAEDSSKQGRKIS